VFCVDLRTNNDYFSLQYQLIGFYNRDRECSLRGMNWIFKSGTTVSCLKGKYINLTVSSSVFENLLNNTGGGGGGDGDSDDNDTISNRRDDTLRCGSE
jgi:hypothetical protein